MPPVACCWRELENTLSVKESACFCSAPCRPRVQQGFPCAAVELRVATAHQQSQKPVPGRHSHVAVRAGPRSDAQNWSWVQEGTFARSGWCKANPLCKSAKAPGLGLMVLRYLLWKSCCQVTARKRTQRGTARALSLHKFHSSQSIVLAPTEVSETREKGVKI